MFSFEIIFVCFVTYYMVEEIMELRKVKLDYFNSAWNVMDLVVILISLFNIVIALYTEVVVTDLLKVLKDLKGKVAQGISTLKCLTSNSLCEPKVFFFRKYLRIFQSLYHFIS